MPSLLILTADCFRGMHLSKIVGDAYADYGRIIICVEYCWKFVMHCQKDRWTCPVEFIDLEGDAGALIAIKNIESAAAAGDCVILCSSNMSERLKQHIWMTGISFYVEYAFLYREGRRALLEEPMEVVD